MTEALTALAQPEAEHVKDGQRPGASAGRPQQGYLAGLDGLRAVAVLVVIVYHSSPSAMRGGYLGVSTFFVLSGYLIGSLCFREVAASGRIRVGRFWERRVRRLMPAALLTLLLVVLLGRFFGITSGPSQRGDLLSALFWSANWRFLAEGIGYRAAFADPSPVQHFWSLAIEEQFYVLFPLLVLGLARIGGGRRSVARVVVGILMLVSFGLAWWSADVVGFDWAYYATYNRAGEILVGVFLALLLRGGVGAIGRSRPLSAGVQAGAAIGLLGLVALAYKVSIGAEHLFSGAIWLNDLFAVAVIVACVVGGPVASLLGLWPLRMLGRISYGVYLFHWPLFLLLDEERTGLHGVALFTVRFAATLVLAIASYHLVESPIRFRRLVPSRQVATTAMAALAVTALVIVAFPPLLTEAQRQRAPLALPSTSGLQQRAKGADFRPSPGVVHPIGGARPRARVLMIGDSVAYTMMPGFTEWNRQHRREQVTVDAYIQMGCPLLAGPEPVDVAGKIYNTPFPPCQRLIPSIAAASPTGDYDVAVVVMGLGDLGKRKVGQTWKHLGNPDFDRRLQDQMAALTKALGDTPVLWATYPAVSIAEVPGYTGTGPFDENDPSRVEDLNEHIRANARAHQQVVVADLHQWCDQLPRGCFDQDLRPDGVHFSWLGAKRADAWLMPLVLDQVDAARPADGSPSGRTGSWATLAELLGGWPPRVAAG